MASLADWSELLTWARNFKGKEATCPFPEPTVAESQHHVGESERRLRGAERSASKWCSKAAPARRKAR